MDEHVSSFRTPDGVSLRVADSGPGSTDGGRADPTLLLVHGWSQDLRTWDRVVDDLRAAGVTGRIVRHDHRGHGGSDAAPRGTATIGRAADDLAALIAERVPDGPLVLAGHSMGGMTLMALAERHPDLVSRRVHGIAFVATASDDMADLDLGITGRRGRLIARSEHLLAPWAAALGHRAPIDRTGEGATAPTRADAEHHGRDGHGRAAPVRGRAGALAPVVRALVFGRHPRRSDVAAVAEQALAADPATVVAFRTSIGEHHRRRALHALAGTPAVVLVGDRDRLCPPRHARVIAEELPDAELVLYPGAGHMITYERAPEVSAHLHGLLLAARESARVPA